MLSPTAYRQLQLEKLKRRALQYVPAVLPAYDAWLHQLFPRHVTASFAAHHRALWDWLEAIMPGARPRPFIALWPRGGGKSATAELGAVRIGARTVRRYLWYISSTQDKADRHVETIAALLESDRLAAVHPGLASRRIGKYGNPKGWRRSRLQTASGLTIDALGLDVGSRGAMVEDQRPDMLILDDVDEKFDTMATVQKKIDVLTTSILPAGSSDCAVLFIQNLIHPGSIASQLSDGRAEFLADRIVSGPFPAVTNLTYEQVDGKFIITGGEATWDGQDLETCQAQITTWGLTAFLKESQHEVNLSGGIWDHIEFRHCERHEVPALVRCAVWVDPAVTSTDNSDSMGIQGDGIAANGVIYRLKSWEAVTSPEDALKRAILWAVEIGADRVGVETDQGGDTWKSVYAQAVAQLKPLHPEIKRFPTFASDKAGAGYGSKVERNQRMLTDYEAGRVIHVVGTHGALEAALARFPLKPLDLSDAAFWSWNDLRRPRGTGMV